MTFGRRAISRHVLAPGMLGAALDVGHAAMVEDELDVRRQVDQRDRLGDLVRQHARDRRSGRCRQAA